MVATNPATTSRRSSSSSRMLLQQAPKSMQATWLGETTALLQLTCSNCNNANSTGTSLNEQEEQEQPKQQQQGHGHNTRPADTVNILFNPSTPPSSSTSSSSSSPRFSLLDCSIGLSRRKSKNTSTSSTTTTVKSRLAGLPDIHYICITDVKETKLDTDIILGLYKRDGARFLVPQNATSSLEKIGIPSHHITEVNAWQDEIVSYSAGSEGSKTLRFTAIPTSVSSIDEKVTLPKQRDGGKIIPSTAHWLVQHENRVTEKSDAESGDNSRSAILFVGGTIASQQKGNNVSAVQGKNNSNKSATAASGGIEKSNTETTVAELSALKSLWREVAARYGPLDLAFLPVWAGKRSAPSFFQRIFAKSTIRKIETFAPTEAAEVHQALCSRVSIAMLHGVEAPSSSFSRAFSSNEDSDDDDNDHSDNTSRAIAKSPEAQKTIVELKSACDRSKRRSVEFRRGGGKNGSLKRKNRNSLMIQRRGSRFGGGNNAGGSKGGVAGSGKSTFVLLNPHQSVQV